MGIEIGSVVIDCNDFDRMHAFWRAALSYVDREEPSDGWVVMTHAERAKVNVSLQTVPEPRAGKNRLHLDLYASDRDAEVDRLVGLGASVERLPEAGEDFVVLSDPEGNLFCVIDHSP